MFSDGVVELYEAGVITNKAKTLHPGKMIATFLMGRRLYDFVHNNPVVEMHPVDYTNDPFVISRNRKMTAVNSALQVDLTGQVCADSSATLCIAEWEAGRFCPRRQPGRGRQSNYCAAFTAQNGQVSRIVTALTEGVRYHPATMCKSSPSQGGGLKGKSIRQRAEALINIAHPDFRGTGRSSQGQASVLSTWPRTRSRHPAFDGTWA